MCCVCMRLVRGVKICCCRCASSRAGRTCDGTLKLLSGLVSLWSCTPCQRLSLYAITTRPDRCGRKEGIFAPDEVSLSASSCTAETLAGFCRHGQRAHKLSTPKYRGTAGASLRPHGQGQHLRDLRFRSRLEAAGLRCGSLALVVESVKVEIHHSGLVVPVPMPSAAAANADKLMLCDV